NGID
ncbi:hypothetical protein VCHC17A1_4057B, partial [Vibrio cholerae HC-17A1]